MSSDRLNVVIVGGAGAMGRYAARSVARLGSADRLVIADLNLPYAERLAAEIGPPCEATSVDATDTDALAKLFADCDVVLNTMGPFAKFATPILRAAIEAGCDYLDIDDDWESTLEALELDELAREHGSRVIVGIGGSPGWCNMCALAAVNRLDDVQEIITGWKLSGSVAEPEADYPATSDGSAAVQHWLLQCSGKIQIMEDGEWREVQPLQRIDIDYPGIGLVRTYSVGHPEAVTLPRYIDGVRRTANVMSGPEWIFDHLRSVAAEYDAGKITLEQGAAALSSPPRPETKAPRDPLFVVWALAHGSRDGQELAVGVRPRAYPRGRMGANTGVPLSIGLELLRQDKVGGPGVRAPEGAIDPDEFGALLTEFIDLPVDAGDDWLVVDEQPR
jgi:saccharopine dehydrogenase-like NADP-dependent oxidoreductase